MNKKIDLLGHRVISKDLSDIDESLADLLRHEDKRLRAVGELFREIIPIMLRWQDRQAKDGASEETLLQHAANIAMTIMMTLPANAVNNEHVVPAWLYVRDLVHDQSGESIRASVSAPNEPVTRH